MLDLDFARHNFPALATDWVLMDNAGGSVPLRGVIDGVSDYMARTMVQHGATYELSVAAVDAVDNRRGLVKFERVVLQRLDRDEEGRETTEEVYRMGMVMEGGRLRVVGAASGPDSKRALFLTVQVSER